MGRTPVICAVAVAGALALAGCGGTTTVVTITTGGTTTGPTTAGSATDGTTTTAADTQGVPTDTTAGRTTLTALPTAPTQTATAPPGTSTDPDDVLVERPANFPNGGERFLLAARPRRRPPLYRQRADSLSRGAVAGLYCDTAGALGATAFYDLFPPVPAWRRPTGATGAATTCPSHRANASPAQEDPSSVPAEGTWTFARGARATSKAGSCASSPTTRSGSSPATTPSAPSASSPPPAPSPSTTSGTAPDSPQTDPR